MNPYLLFAGMLCCANTATAQQELVPRQYREIKSVQGDLDKDGIPEKVVAYNMKEEEETNGVDRELVIFKKQKSKWTIWKRSTQAIGNSMDGGMMGDPFEDIAITGGLLVISQSGGSNWKWNRTDKYRYQNNQFELIGYTNLYGMPCAYWATADYNLSTGKLVYKKEKEQCDDEGNPIKVTKEAETFIRKLPAKITLGNRKSSEIKIVTPKYKGEIYL